MLHKLDNSHVYIIVSCGYWFVAALTFPILTLHLLEQGISIKEVGLVSSFSAIVYLLLDVPIGAISDRISKRFIFTISTLFHALGYVIWSVGSGVQMAIIAYSIWGAGRAFYSGSLEAWYVNTITSDNRISIMNKTFNHSSIGISLAIALGVFLTGYLSYSAQTKIFNSSMILNAAAVGMIILGIFSFSAMKEDIGPENIQGCNEQQSSKIPFSKQFYNALEVLGNMNFSRYLCLSFAYGLCFGFFEVFWMPLGIDLSMTEFQNTIAYASSYLASAIVLILLLRVSTKSNYELWIPIVRIAFSASFFLLSFTTSYIGFIIAMVLIYVLSFIEAPMIQTGLNNAIEDDSRSLMLSCDSMVKQGVGIISGLAGAWVYQNEGAQAILIFISVITALSVLPYLYAHKVIKKKRIHS
ncbi:Tetracycline resistance protein [Moritella sp. JT01]|uniref:MFS transporter n=1 Tax=Moritella sp. JT01 TaxID=756698 RepID=UPI0007981F8C|nr:MFS transporter [Moritella sp. JT01]KXO11554.1 Tetracycline resistance protein [Moritella sp. JT01]